MCKYGFSVLPWLGVDYEIVDGELSVVPPGPPTTVVGPIDDRRVFPLAGLNLKGNLFHFLEGEFKYLARFDADDYFSDLSVIVNVFFSRHWGGSYRYMHMENLSGVITYHIWGISPVFCTQKARSGRSLPFQDPIAEPSSAMTSEAFPRRKMSDT